MQDYSSVSEIRAVSSYEEVNALLKDYWKLLDIFHDSDGLPIFVLGDQHDSMREFVTEMEIGVS